MNVARSLQPPRRLHPFILFAAFLSTFYVALLGPILPALAEPYGGNAFTIGLLFSCYSFAQFLSAPALGAIGDRASTGPIGGRLVIPSRESIRSLLDRLSPNIEGITS